MTKGATNATKRRQAVQADFIEAILEGKVRRVKAIYKAGASVTASDQHGWLPIHRASTNNHGRIVRLLISWGSPLEERGTDGWTPLHLAAVSRSPAAVAELIAAGAQVNARSDFGSTPLHLAVGCTLCEGMIETVELLIAAGAKPSARDRRGRSPLREVWALVDQTNRLFKAIRAGRRHNRPTRSNSP
jgi:ankyrin repeat protein